MSKAFTRENDSAEGDDLDEPDQLPAHAKNYVTPQGLAALKAELYKILREDRPSIVEMVSWAAGNGDRSENGDYIYGKKRLREIDRRVRYLAKRLDTAVLVDPRQQQNIARVFFGATVAYAHEDGRVNQVKLVGIDEADVVEGKISWLSPVAQALMKAGVNDSVKLRTPGGNETLSILGIHYELGGV